MDKESKEDQDKMRETFRNWADQALEGEAYPVIAISMKSNDEIILHRSTEYPTWKLKKFLHAVADSL